MNSQNPMIDNNDPRLTAYALGELAPADVVEIEAALKSSPKLRAVVADIRQATETISKVFLAEPSLQLTPEQKSELLVEAKSASNFDVHSDNARSNARAAASATPAVANDNYQPSSASKVHWLKIAVAAGLTSVLIGGAYYLSQIGRQPMAAADRALLETESPAVNEQAADKSFDAPQILPPTSNQSFDGTKGGELAKADSAVQPSPMKPNSYESMKRLSDVAESEADDSFELKFKPQDEMPPPMEARSAPSGFPSRARAAVEPNSAARSKRLARRNPKFSEGQPSSPNSIDRKAESNPNTLAQAQQAVDRSLLGSLNLTVAAQSFGGAGGGGLGAGAQFKSKKLNSKQSKLIPTIEGLAPQQSLEDERLKPNSSTTFALQISDQDAVQMVNLLASYADPQRKRQLSFDDLIDTQALPLVENQIERNDIKPGQSSDEANQRFADGFSDAAPALENKPLLNQMTASSASTTPLQLAAAATLATKLRELTGRPSLTIRGLDAPSIAAEEDAEQDLAINDSSSAYGDQRNGVLKKQATLNGNTLEGQLNEVTENDLLGVSKADSDSAKDQLLPNEFNFDYSQIIEQLKLKLKIRNESVTDSK